MNPAVVRNERVPGHPTHLISIRLAIARLLLIGCEIDMRDIRSGHYRFFILLFGLQMKRGARARRLSLIKERSQISSESYESEEGAGEKWQGTFVEILSGLTELEKRQTVLVHWERGAQMVLLYQEGTALYVFKKRLKKYLKEKKKA